jgi:hypothetical protein
MRGENIEELWYGFWLIKAVVSLSSRSWRHEEAHWMSDVTGSYVCSALDKSS